MTARAVVEPGQIFGGLSAIEEAESRFYARVVVRRFKFLCECGSETIQDLPAVRAGRVVSCGCRRKEITRAASKESNTVHGYRSHYLYITWQSAKQRCYNPNHKAYVYYGARGISMAKEWVDDPAEFIEYILKNLGERPEGMTLDRIDNDSDYKPGNLRWATRSQQQLNKRRKR